MSDFPNIDKEETKKRGPGRPKKATRSRSGSDVPPHMAATDPSVGEASREDVAHGKHRAPRVPMNTGDLALSVPDGTIPEGMVGHWFVDDDRGRIQAAKAAYWEHVTDSNGVNISRQSGPKRLYLMALEEKYYKEDEELRMKNYRASIGENDTRDLGVDGIEQYLPEGQNKIKVDSDPFSK